MVGHRNWPIGIDLRYWSTWKWLLSLIWNFLVTHVAFNSVFGSLPSENYLPLFLIFNAVYLNSAWICLKFTLLFQLDHFIYVLYKVCLQCFKQNWVIITLENNVSDELRYVACVLMVPEKGDYLDWCGKCKNCINFVQGSSKLFWHLGKTRFSVKTSVSTIKVSDLYHFTEFSCNQSLI